MQAGVCGVRRVRTLKDTKLLLLDLYSLVEFAGGVPRTDMLFFFSDPNVEAGTSPRTYNYYYTALSN